MRPGRAAATAEHAARAAAGPPAWPSLVLAVLAFVGYASLTGTVSADKDSSEFTLVLATLGVAHPTGYALHTVLGHLFVRLARAFGAGWPQAAALWSAFAAAAAVGLLHHLSARWLAARETPSPRAWIVALLPPVLFGALPLWTFEATVAEVGTFHVAWLALAVLVSERAMLRANALPPLRAGLIGLVLGAGLAHHLSSALWVLPLVVVLWPRVARGHSSAIAAFAAGLLALPAAGVAYVAWRADAADAVRWTALEPSFRSVVEHVTGAQYRHYLGRFAPSPSQWSLFVRFVLPLLPLAIAGLVLSSFDGPRPKRSPIARALLAAGLAQTLFAFVYGVPDPMSYFLPVLGIGLASVPGGVLAWGAAGRRAGPLKFFAAVAIAVVLPSWVTLAIQRTRMYANFDALVRSMWQRIPDEPGYVVWGDDMSHKLREYQLLEAQGRSLTVVDPAMLIHPVARARFRAAQGWDPFAGAALPSLTDPRAAAAFSDSVAHLLNARTSLPVYLFDPATPSVRLLLKPGAAAPDSSRSR